MKRKIENQGIKKIKLYTKEEAIKEVSQDGYILQNLTEDMKNEKDVVMKAVSQKGNSLYYASDRLKDDKDVVLKSVSQDG